MKARTIKIAGTNTFYREKGRGDALLILHGWGSSSDTWIKVQEKVADSGFHVVAVDLPGFGQTEEPPSTWSIADYSDFVHNFAKQIKIKNFVLAGHSFGGRIALDYAVRYPKDLKKLVLIAAAGVIRHKKAKISIFLIFTKIGDKVFSVPGLRRLKNIVRHIWYKITGEHDYHKASPRMKQIMSQILDENLRAYLPRITLPTLILWGEKDTTTPLIDAKILNKEIPNSYLHIFSGEPHALQIKIPEQLANKIIQFL